MKDKNRNERIKEEGKMKRRRKDIMMNKGHKDE